MTSSLRWIESDVATSSERVVEWEQQQAQSIRRIIHNDEYAESIRASLSLVRHNEDNDEDRLRYLPHERHQSNNLISINISRRLQISCVYDEDPPWQLEMGWTTSVSEAVNVDTTSSGRVTMVRLIWCTAPSLQTRLSRHKKGKHYQLVVHGAEEALFAVISNAGSFLNETRHNFVRPSGEEAIILIALRRFCSEY